MFCTKCGLKNDDTSLFCAGCGAKLSKPQYAQNAPEQIPFSEEASPVENAYDNVENEIVNNTAYDNSDELKENVQEMIGGDSSDTYAENNSADFQRGIDLMKEGQENSSDGMQPEGSFANTQNSEPVPVYEQPQNDSQNNFSQQPFNNQSNFGGRPYDNQEAYNAVPKNKFSFKRFFFSMIIILASVAACAVIVMNYVGIKISYEGQGNTQATKGYDVIKQGVEFDEENIAYDVDALNELKDAVDNFRIIVIAFEIALVVIAVIDLILLIAVRKKGGYVLTMFFSLLKMGLGGYAIYLWCFDVLDKLKEVFVQSSGLYLQDSLKLTFTVEIGAILAVGLQLVIFICSIILLTCKNRQKIAQ